MKTKYIIQEKHYDDADLEVNWYDDPDLIARYDLEDCKSSLAAELSENPPHDKYYNHRIIERTERVVS